MRACVCAQHEGPGDPDDGGPVDPVSVAELIKAVRWNPEVERDSPGSLPGVKSGKHTRLRLGEIALPKVEAVPEPGLVEEPDVAARVRVRASSYNRKTDVCPAKVCNQTFDAP